MHPTSPPTVGGASSDDILPDGKKGELIYSTPRCSSQGDSRTLVAFAEPFGLSSDATGYRPPASTFGRIASLYSSRSSDFI